MDRPRKRTARFTDHARQVAVHGSPSVRAPSRVDSWIATQVGGYAWNTRTSVQFMDRLRSAHHHDRFMDRHPGRWLFVEYPARRCSSWIALERKWRNSPIIPDKWRFMDRPRKKTVKFTDHSRQVAVHGSPSKKYGEIHRSRPTSGGSWIALERKRRNSPIIPDKWRFMDRPRKKTVKFTDHARQVAVHGSPPERKRRNSPITPD